MKVELQYPTVIQSIASIRSDLKTFADEADIPASELRQITLVVEEMYSKIIKFAFQDKGKHLLHISILKTDAEIIIEMKDDGKTFDPLTNDPELGNDPALIDEGSMGLSLIRAFCDSIQYSREDGRNILRIQKLIRGQSDTELK